MPWKEYLYFLIKQNPKKCTTICFTFFTVTAVKLEKKVKHLLDFQAGAD